MPPCQPEALTWARISMPLFSSVAARSYWVCKLSQNWGEFPKKQPILIAVSGVMARFPRRISMIRPDGTPSEMASLFALKPRASSSFLRILPGCVGNLFMFMILSFPSWKSLAEAAFLNLLIMLYAYYERRSMSIVGITSRLPFKALAAFLHGDFQKRTRPPKPGLVGWHSLKRNGVLIKGTCLPRFSVLLRPLF